jgi:hypothetical protein
MGIGYETVKNTDDAFQEFDAFTNSLRPTDEESGRFYHIVSALTDATKTNYVTLRKAFADNDQTLIAWSCRNLLEIAIFTKFALRSKKNANEFAADRLIDGLQIGVALKKLEMHLNPEVKESPYDKMIDSFSSQMTDEGITRTKFLEVRKLAEQVEMLDEFETINKVSSKFIHPTAWSLLTADIGAERFPEARDLFFAYGALYFATVFAEVRPHIRKWGLRHKPE